MLTRREGAGDGGRVPAGCGHDRYQDALYGRHGTGQTRIKSGRSRTKILIFTGFDEFEYAKEAVHLEVEEYLLKPVNSVELTDVFSSLKIKLDQEISEKQNAEILQKYYMESLPLLQANFYSTLIDGRIRKDEVDKYISDYQIALEGPYFCCLVIHTSSGQVPENMSPMLLATSVQKTGGRASWEEMGAKCFTYLGNTVLITQLKSENEVSELTDECDRFCKYARRIIGAVVTVGVGQVCSDMLELSQSYSSAREAVSYRIIYGASRAVNIKEVAPQETGDTEIINDAELANLFKAIRMSSDEEVKKAVNRYLNHVAFPVKSLQQHHVMVMELVSALYRFEANNDMEIEGFSEDMRTLYGRLIDMDPESLRNWLTDICLSFRVNLITARSRSTRSFVQRAEEYVRENYADEELSLDNVCQVLGVSNSYFSSMFKKEKGTSFIGYLTDYRMEQASRLLIETDEKNYVIAKQVGYADPNYFSYVFKRRFGVSPVKYRTEHRESQAEYTESER